VQSSNGTTASLGKKWKRPRLPCVAAQPGKAKTPRDLIDRTKISWLQSKDFVQKGNGPDKAHGTLGKTNAHRLG
jgi:hypothetical protein